MTFLRLDPFRELECLANQALVGVRTARTLPMEALRRGEQFMTVTQMDPDVVTIRPVSPRTHRGCEECLRLGTQWVDLRLCLTCGHVGCCDSSPMRHATAHFHASDHPIVQSLAHGETWRWCYVHENYV